jgi:hypothetical protein
MMITERGVDTECFSFEFSGFAAHSSFAGGASNGGLTRPPDMAILAGMASETIKGTYSLDVETVRALERLARRWNVSKSEALRRVIQASAAQAPRDAEHEALRALDELQRALDLSTGAAARWSARARADRRSASRRREPGGR